MSRIGATLEANMVTTQKFKSPAAGMMAVVEFFERIDRKNGGDGIVWCKATAPKGRQVCVEVKTPNGQRLPLPPIKAGEPVCLSQFANFEALKDAPDLSRCAQKGLIRLMDSQEADSFFVKKASILNTTPQALVDKAQQAAMQTAYAEPLADSAIDKSQRLSNEFVSVEDVVNPRIQHICGEMSTSLADGQARLANDILSELVDMEESLTLEDFDFLYAGSTRYPSVRKWTAAARDALAEREGLLSDASDE